MRKVFLGILMLTASAVSKEVALDGERVLFLPVSNQEMTRISLQGEEIRDVFIYPSTRMEEFKLHESGHVFFAPSTQEGAISVTLLGEEGRVQDLRIHPKKGIKSSPINLVLKKKVSKKDIEINWALGVLEKAMDGRTPHGFQPISVSDKSSAEASERRVAGQNLKLSKKYRRGEEVIKVFSGTNESSFPLLLNPNQISTKEDMAVMVSPHVLPKGEIKLITLRKEPYNDKTNP